VCVAVSLRPYDKELTDPQLQYYHGEKSPARTKNRRKYLDFKEKKSRRRFLNFPVCADVSHPFVKKEGGAHAQPDVSGETERDQKNR